MRIIKKVQKGFSLGIPALLPLLRNPKKLIENLIKAWDLWRHGGLGAVKLRLLKKNSGYSKWVSLYGHLTDTDREQISARIKTLGYRPKFSIVMPTYNTDAVLLRAAIDSVHRQLYPDWELCIADDCSKLPHIRDILSEYSKADPRIRVVFRDKNGHIAAASNSALELATGDFIALLDHDDELTEHALYMMAEELNTHPDADILYSDEDKLDPQGQPTDPYFKSDWNPDLFYCQNMISHLGVYRAALVKSVGGFRPGFDGSQDYDLALRVLEKTKPEQVRHIPHVLYHWRIIPGSIAMGPTQKSYAHDIARKAIQEHLDRQGVQAKVERGFSQLHRVRYPIPEPAPLVSLIIGTKDKVDLLKPLINGLLHQTDYPALEILILDNRSKELATLRYFEKLRTDPRVRILPYDAPFNFSALNNWGVQQARGKIIGLLNNDLKVISPGWLKEMVSNVLRPEVGCVGAKLYYPNNMIQHAGVILGIQGLAGHSHRGYLRSEPGFMGRAVIAQALSAVTAACLLVRREVYEQVGGLDEERFAVAFNDVDFCLKVREAGYRNIFTPYAELYHFESATRGSDSTPENRPRFEREAAALREKWGEQLKQDPAYSPNLTIEGEDFAFAYPPRVVYPWK
ncbi:glycosyltransferase family 2 protein [Bdellovibrionota bacterium FG-1]